MEEEIKNIISQNKEMEPAVFALSFRLENLPVSQIATQIKYLQKSKEKLPSYYNACAIIPPLAYEQSSSESAANHKHFEGKLAIDLTCGLGVDSLHFSKHFEKVISVEKNKTLCEIAQHNFRLMNVENVTLIHDTAEHFMKEYKGTKADLIYVDPSRRDESGDRVFLPEMLQPNLDTLLPILKKHAASVVIKMSPLYDVHAARLQFKGLSEIQIISVKGECKEVLLIIKSGEQSSENCPIRIFCDAYGVQELNYYFEKPSIKNKQKEDNPLDVSTFLYMYEPDVAFYKSRTVPSLFEKYYSKVKGRLNTEDGFFFSNERLSDFPGRVYEIRQPMLFNPRAVRAFLKKEKIQQIMIHQRNFINGVKEIRNRLKVKDGGSFTLICTSMPEGSRVAILAKRI